MRSAALILAAMVTGIPTLASGQVAYLVQTRSVHIAGTTVNAPDFGPFDETLNYDSPFGCLSTGAHATAQGRHDSTLGPDSIEFDLHTTGAGGGTSTTLLDVTVSVPAGAAYSLIGHTHWGQGPMAGYGGGNVAFFGPSVSLNTPGPGLFIFQTIPFSQSGVLQRGQYTLQVDTHAQGLCIAGMPAAGTGDAIGSLKIVMPWCRVDLDGNHVTEPSDVAAFISVWAGSLAQGTLAGDFDGDGAVTPSDVATFVAAWFESLTSTMPC